MSIFSNRKLKSTNRFGWLRYVLLPWLSMIAISGVLVGTLYPPPPAPLYLAPIVVLIWLFLGIGVLRFLQIHNPEAIRQAGRLFVVDETETLKENNMDKLSRKKRSLWALI